jgi:ABC-type glycerol-3-phosphate transport system permease component
MDRRDPRTRLEGCTVHGHHSISRYEGIPEDLYDAARADGANAWQRFWGLTVLFAISTTRATLVVSYLAAYAFARIPFPGSGVLL